MRLNKILINDNIAYTFHDGLNIILGINNIISQPEGSSDQDDIGTEKVPDTNGVGKTLLTNLIKHALGGDTESAFSSSYFQTKKLWVTLEVSKQEKTYVISRALWEPLDDDLYLFYQGPLGHFQGELKKAGVNLISITDPRVLSLKLNQSKSNIKELNKKEFQQRIAKIENIDYSKANISLSALLDFMIRDEKVGFSDTIARIRRSQWVQYRSIQYLFGLPASVEDECRKLKEEIDELGELLSSKRKILAEKAITNVDKIENLKIKTEARLEKAREAIKQVNISPSLDIVRKRYFEEKLRVAEINSQINQKEHYLKGYQNNLEDLENKSNAMGNLLKIDEFYNDIIQFFPKQLSENISKYNEFFNEVAKDREKYYLDLISQIKSDLKFLLAEKKNKEPALEELAKQFKNTNVVRDISYLALEEQKISAELLELDRLRQVLIECDSLEEKIKNLEDLRSKRVIEGKRLEKQHRENRSRVINLFHELVTQIYGIDDSVLEFEYCSNIASSEAGRTEILCSIPSQGSHGRTYAKINIFDFVWFLRDREESEFNPDFLIHDGSYAKISKDVKEKMLSAVISRLGKKQYFVTLNEGEINLTEDLKKLICCPLDGSKTEGKLFREQFE